jgi:hypothetical protein
LFVCCLFGVVFCTTYDLPHSQQTHIVI